MIENMTKTLVQVQNFLTTYLHTNLPQISKNWWNDCVIDSLADQQKYEISIKKIKSLTSLDLAMLLKVFQRNCLKLDNFLSTNGVKLLAIEMLKIRNKYSHYNLDKKNITVLENDVKVIEKFLLCLGLRNNLIDDLLKPLKNDINDKFSKRNPKSVFSIENIAKIKIENKKTNPVLEFVIQKPNYPNYLVVTLIQKKYSYTFNSNNEINHNGIGKIYQNLRFFYKVN